MASKVLQEFLVRLRFEVDKGEQGKVQGATESIAASSEKASKRVSKSSKTMSSNFVSSLNQMTDSSKKAASDIDNHATTISSSLGKIGKGTVALGLAAIGTAIRVNDIGENYIKSTNAANFAVRRLGANSIQNFKAMNFAAQAVGITTDEITGALETLNSQKFRLGASTANAIQQSLLAPNILPSDTSEERLNKIAVHANEQYKANPNNSIELMAKAEGAGFNPQLMQYMMQYGADYKKEYEKFNPEVGKADDLNKAKTLEITNTELHTEALLKGKAAASEMTEEYLRQRQKFADFAMTVAQASTNNVALGIVITKELASVETLTKALSALALVTLVAGGVSAISSGVVGLLGASALGFAFKDQLAAIATSVFAANGIETPDILKSDKEEPNKEGFFKRNFNDATNYMDEKELKAYDLGQQLIGHNTSKQIFNEFRGLKYNERDAADIAANFREESGNNPFKYGDNNKAYGLGQWHKDRIDAYKNATGIDIRSFKDYDQATQEQIKMADWELKHTEKENWERGHASGRTDSIYSRFVERPAAVDEAALNRGHTANAILGNRVFNVTQNITGTADPKQTADKATESLQHLYDSSLNSNNAR